MYTHYSSLHHSAQVEKQIKSFNTIIQMHYMHRNRQLYVQLNYIVNFWCIQNRNIGQLASINNGVFIFFTQGLQCKHHHHWSCDSTAWGLSGRPCGLCQGTHSSWCKRKLFKCDNWLMLNDMVVLWTVVENTQSFIVLAISYYVLYIYTLVTHVHVHITLFTVCSFQCACFLYYM